MTKTDYVIYDGRYHDDPDEATVMTIRETHIEAIEDRPAFGDDCVIVKEISEAVLDRRGRVSGWKVLSSEVVNEA